MLQSFSFYRGKIEVQQGLKPDDQSTLAAAGVQAEEGKIGNREAGFP
jgi:hypothetical protein